jgi:hypothetical protein
MAVLDDRTTSNLYPCNSIYPPKQEDFPTYTEPSLCSVLLLHCEVVGSDGGEFAWPWQGEEALAVAVAAPVSVPAMQPGGQGALRGPLGGTRERQLQT